MVDAEIEEQRLRLPADPVAARRVAPRGTSAKVDRHAIEPAEDLAAHQLGGTSRRRKVAEVLIDHQHPAPGLSQPNEGSSVLDTWREGFFDKHMQARIQRLANELAMPVCSGGNEKGVGVRAAHGLVDRIENGAGFASERVPCRACAIV